MKGIAAIRDVIGYREAGMGSLKERFNGKVCQAVFIGEGGTE
jgi:hypothetical protein